MHLETVHNNVIGASKETRAVGDDNNVIS